MRVRYTDTAVHEVSEILDHIAKKNPQTADEITAAIGKTIDLIERQPFMARVVYRGRVRAFPLDRFPYRIFYEVDLHGIIIRNVRHMRREHPWEG